MNLKDNTTSAKDRFWARVNKNGPVCSVHGPCWIWTGTTSGTARYGILQVSGKKTKAHIFSYELCFGKTNGLFVCHKCDNPLCVRPDHLFLGTHAENMADMVSKGRANRGEKRPAAKLTEADVQFIRASYQAGSPIVGAIALSERFGVNYYTVMAIITGKAWKHVK